MLLKLLENDLMRLFCIKMVVAAALKKRFLTSETLNSSYIFKFRGVLVTLLLSLSRLVIKESKLISDS